MLWVCRAGEGRVLQGTRGCTLDLGFGEWVGAGGTEPPGSCAPGARMYRDSEGGGPAVVQHRAMVGVLQGVLHPEGHRLHVVGSVLRRKWDGVRVRGAPVPGPGP